MCLLKKTYFYFAFFCVNTVRINKSFGGILDISSNFALIISDGHVPGKKFPISELSVVSLMVQDK